MLTRYLLFSKVVRGISGRYQHPIHSRAEKFVLGLIHSGKRACPYRLGAMRWGMERGVEMEFEN
jgi:hypothetical protein